VGPDRANSWAIERLPGRPRLASVDVTATPDLLSFVEEQGGSLFVRCQRRPLIRGVSFLRATTKEPRSLAGYEVFVVEGIFVLTHLPARSRPKELHLSLEGRRKRRPVAAWDGCAFVV
jgi:hypothetical protein